MTPGARTSQTWWSVQGYVSLFKLKYGHMTLLGKESALSCCNNYDRMISTTFSFSKSYELGINV